MKQQTVIGVAVALATIAVFWGVGAFTAQPPAGGGQVCIQDVKFCPDGSAVGRTGPNCEFAACPASGSVSLSARLGQEVSGLGVRITPMELLEDSRCPIDVQCIQAGTVWVRARLISGLGEANQEFKLGQPITTEVERVTLVDVSPAPRAGVAIPAGEYLFRFEVAKRTDLPLVP